MDHPTIDHLPLIFHNPPGWPTPTQGWVAEHLGWVPPVGWTPLPGASRAPGGWTFWTRDPIGWREFTRSNTASARRSLWIGLTIFAAGILFTFIGYESASGGFVVFWGAIIFGGIQWIRAVIHLRRIDALCHAQLILAVAIMREEGNRLAYGEYLADQEGSR